MPVVVYGTRYCGASKLVKRDLSACKDLEVEYMRIEGDPARISDHGLLAVPTIQVIVDCEVVKTFVGYNKNLVKKIREVFDVKN